MDHDLVEAVSFVAFVVAGIGYILLLLWSKGEI